MRMLALAAVGLLAGCGGSPPPVAIAEQPLTLAEWEGLPADRKYQAESYERLKLGEPKFQDEKVWDRFYRQTVLTGQKKEQAKK
ncbi:MAG: hypothetical protein KF873_18165 [Gemmataceae bacterium]|nr:hypothetical protein [Gemmataceae bacterium]